ncbi:MAG: M16 family metallopeptidase [Polyangiales bacterium]
MRLRFAALFALAVGLVEAPAASTTAKSAPSLAFERYVLPNGLEVILHEDHKTPIVAVNVWYHVGGKDEPQGKNGFAHLFEHVMFQGSKNVGEDMFFKYLERAGASDRNGTTSQDRTNYFETVPSNELALALWLESDRMGTLLDHANDETFKSQRDEVKNERRQNYENAPYGLVPQFIHNAMFPKDHPYHRLVIGTPEDLDAASFEDVKQFFRTWYVPNNATLVLAGDFEPLEAKALVAKYFGTLQKQPDPHPKTQPVPVTLEAEKRLNVEAEVELARVVIDWPTAAHFAPGDSDLDLVANVLSNGKTSRLYKRLVYDLQIAQDVYAQQESMLLGSNFEISVTVRKGKDPLEVLKIVDEELAKLRDTPVADDELARARTRMISTLIFSAERVTARADMLNAYAQEAHDPGYFTKDLARYESASAATLQAAAQRWLPAGKRVLVVVTPTKGAPRAGRLVEAK